MNDKLNKLKEIIKNMRSALVAYSGGVDSTLLLKIAHDELKDKLLAVIASSDTYPEEEIEAAKDMAENLGVKYIVIQTEEHKDENFVSNPPERCYYCKKELFFKLSAIARQNNINYVLDGSNYDDKSDFRPGERAAKEFKVRSPLREVAFRKAEIRELSKELGLPTWDKPSFACLSSRIPYGTRITKDILEKIEEGENFLKSLGFKNLRVRHHGHIARIEIGKEEISVMINNGMMEKVSRKFEKLGYVYVTLDLKGFRSGSMNEVLRNK